MLLDPQSIHQYHELRDGLFAHVRLVDELAQSLLPDVPEAIRVESRRMRVPGQFGDLTKYVERKLREARAASLSEEAFSNPVGLKRVRG
jgi:hypothetical protein